MVLLRFKFLLFIFNFFQRNGTTWGDGEFNMFTGEDDVSRLGQIHTWNHQHQTNFDDECGKIQGSAQGFYPPGMTQPNILLYSHEACRFVAKWLPPRSSAFSANTGTSVWANYEAWHVSKILFRVHFVHSLRALSFNYKGRAEVHSVASLVYKLDETTFANGTVHPPNQCFHNNLPSGVQNNTKCQRDSPSFLSFPHFFHADPFYVDQFTEGSLRPSAEKHESKIVLEPVSTYHRRWEPGSWDSIVF